MVIDTVARAETVMVKYVGPVDLSTMKCGWTESSLVHRICYRRSDQYLVVLLKNTYYQYCGISSPVVGEWVNADSLGRYYLAAVKGNYDCMLGKR